MELHQDDSFEYAIRIKYNGQYAAMCEKATTKCEYRNFWNRLNLNSTDYKAACYNKWKIAYINYLALILFLFAYLI